VPDDPQIIAGLPGEWAARDGHAVDARHHLALVPGEEHHSGDMLVKVIAHRPGYLCPIPPAQNRLPFAVDVGERFPLR